MGLLGGHPSSRRHAMVRRSPDSRSRTWATATVQRGPTTQSHGQQGASTSRVSIKHLTLAWWGGVAGVAALGALIAVAWVTDSDVLATTALYLAVLSFLVQLILYVVQAWTTNQQQLRAEQVHHDTAIVLTRIEEIALRINAAGEAQTQSMQDLITRIASRVVGDLRIPDTDESEEAEEPEKPLTNEEIEERVAAAVRRELASNPSIPRYTPSRRRQSSSLLEPSRRRQSSRLLEPRLLAEALRSTPASVALCR